MVTAMKHSETEYRHELKYRVSRGSYEILRGRLKAAMRSDPNAENGRYRITSLYFDDPYRSAYFDKQNGILNRKKFRIRTYNLDPAFIRLEEKCKNGDMGYKKNAVLSLGEYHALLSGKTDFLSEERFSGTAAEDFLWANAAARLAPAVVVDYLREPYICAAGNVRITFDLRISAGNTRDFFDPNTRFTPALPNDEAVLEIKYDRFLPLYIEELLSGVPLLYESLSKFVLCSDTARFLQYGC